MNNSAHKMILKSTFDLISFVVICYAFGLLLVGQFSYDERLDMMGVPINTLYFMLSPIVLVLYCRSGLVQKHLIIWFFPIVVGSAALMWSSNPDYGLYKISNLLLTSYLVSTLFIEVSTRRGEAYLFSSILYILLIYSILTVIYKLKVGFFNRDELFLLNGPIIFARLMGCGGIIALVLFRKNIKSMIAYLWFSACVVWTFSKGPILAYILSTVIAMINRKRMGMIFSFSVLGGVFVVSTMVGVVDFEAPPGSARLMEAYDHVVNGVGNIGASGSMGTRILMYEETIELILQNPMGVGLGGWSAHVNIGHHLYPHNFFLEVLSEFGWLLGFIALIPFLGFLLSRRKGVAYYICWFFLLSLQVSGDMLDARYLLVFSLLELYRKKTPEEIVG